MQIRLDYVFSYWIFVWYILYMCNIVSTSPKLVLCIALLFNAISFSTLLYRRVKAYNVIKFLTMNMLIKYLPLYTILNERITNDQVVATLIVSIVYAIYVQASNGSIYNTYTMLYTQHSDSSTHKTPTSIVYDRLFLV